MFRFLCCLRSHEKKLNPRFRSNYQLLGCVHIKERDKLRSFHQNNPVDKQSYSGGGDWNRHFQKLY